MPTIAELVYVLLPDDVRGDYPRPHRRAFAERMKFSRGAVHPALGDADLFPDRAYGLVWAGPDAISDAVKALAAAGDAAAKDRGAGQTRLKSTPTPAGSSRRVRSTSRRHRGAHQRRHRRPRRALLIGKRTGYGKDLMAPHSLTMSMIGASLLWVGWFGFNAGSNLEAMAVQPSP